MRKNRFFRAFTLAEVLITLTVIGVVAALTVPVLMAEYQKHQYVVGVKKFYTNFSQVLETMMADGNCTGDFSCLGIFSPTPSISVYDAFAPYLKYTAYRHSYDSSNRGFGKFTNYVPVKTLNGSIVYNVWDGETFALNDGSIVDIYTQWDGMQDCAATSQWMVGQMCTYISVDTNGAKGPSIAGRDVFTFFITKKGTLAPIGSKSASSNWTNGGGSWGIGTCDQNTDNANGCSGRIMDEGWQMNY